MTRFSVLIVSLAVLLCCGCAERVDVDAEISPQQKGSLSLDYVVPANATDDEDDAGDAEQGNETVAKSNTTKPKSDWKTRHKTMWKALRNPQTRPRLLLGTVGLIIIASLGLMLICHEWGRVDVVEAVPIIVDDTPSGMADPDKATLKRLRREKFQGITDQAMSKKRVEDITTKIIACEAMLRTGQGVDPQQRSRTAMQQMDMAAEKNVTSVLAYVMPAAVQGQRVMQAMERRSQLAKQKANEIAREEVGAFWTDVQDMLQVEGVSSSLLDTVRNLDVPTLATLLASAFAPAQLRTFHLTSVLKSLQLGTYFILTMLVLLWDAYLRCESGPYAGTLHRHSVYLWYEVDACVGGFCLLVHFWCLHKLGNLLIGMAEPPVIADVKDPLVALRMLTEHYVTAGSEALKRTDEVVNSFAYRIANWVSVFEFIWMCIATDMCLNTKWNRCSSMGLVILRLRMLIFLAFFIPILINLLLFFFTKFLGTESFQISAITFAESTDEFLDIKLPVVSIVVQAILVRNRHDMASVHMRKYKLKKIELKSKQQAAEAKLAEIAKSQKFAETHTAALTQLRTSMGENDTYVHMDKQEKEQILQGAEGAFCNFNAQAHEATKQAEQNVKLLQENMTPEQEGEPVPAAERNPSGQSVSQSHAQSRGRGSRGGGKGR